MTRPAQTTVTLNNCVVVIQVKDGTARLRCHCCEWQSRVRANPNNGYTDTPNRPPADSLIRARNLAIAHLRAAHMSPNAPFVEPEPEPLTEVTHIVHDSTGRLVNSYQRGCRCADCKATNARYQREYMQRRRARERAVTS